MADLSHREEPAIGIRVELRPITSDDVDRAARFLNAELNSRVPAVTWAAAMRQPWQADAPNYGFMLLSGDEVVGLYLAFYSQRIIAGEVEKICNLAAWCVLEPYRAHGLRLVKSMIGQQDYAFTDLSPSGNVIEFNKRLNFQHLDTATALVPNIPWLNLGGISITSDPAEIAPRLAGHDLQIFRDHAQAPAAHHVVVSRDGRHCYIIFRRDRRKRLPLFASVLFVSDPELFGRVARHFYAHLLTRFGIPFTLVEKRLAHHLPKLAFLLRSARPKMFRSTRLRPEQVDYLYSELTCVPW